MIGIIGAMDEEILELKKIIDIHEERSILDVTFYIGDLNKNTNYIHLDTEGTVGIRSSAFILESGENISDNYIYLSNIGTNISYKNETKSDILLKLG